ncbi:hypothetical protein [Pasteurella multocida]|uniref:hypothetical protein n=1 Tax=Pasteurella multocida TaxID=747 RepID=UPI00146148F8|nr:hypothetical protein [Pasteurella multocida]NMR52216.1 hypothetical protein [Pasteurella multocida]NMR62156.1 hypothetical protein [Pasteurella multocida]
MKVDKRKGIKKRKKTRIKDKEREAQENKAEEMTVRKRSWEKEIKRVKKKK